MTDARLRTDSAWLRLAVLGLAVAAVGLPVNHLFGYAILLAATILVFYGNVTLDIKRWLAAAAALALIILAQFALAPPRIEEGHNAFLIDPSRTENALKNGLPPDVFNFLSAEFDKAYPLANRCVPRDAGCWRGQNFPAQTFAFSADSVFDPSPFSRRVTGIDFEDPIWHRLGFINDGGYNWNDLRHDMHRGYRDPRVWVFLHRWRLTMPWFTMYRFPAAFVGSELCWRGDVLWEGSGERFTVTSHATMACRTLAPEDAGKRIFASAIRPDSLAMKLEPTAKIRTLQTLTLLLSLAAIALMLGVLVRCRWREIVMPASLIGLSLVVVILSDASLLGGFRYHDGGDDGLVYEGYARRMLQATLRGDWFTGLRGEEDVFYFVPGFRYFRLLERIIFGESNLGYLSLLLMLPVVTMALFRRFLPPRWALALILIFLLTPLGLVFGSNFFLYLKFTSRGYADPAAFTLLLAGLLLIVGRKEPSPDRSFGKGFCGALLLALAVLLRPNLAPITGMLLGGSGIAALYQRNVRHLAGMCIGFLPVSLAAIHNWYYGGVFVPFSSNAYLAFADLSTAPIRISPLGYLYALQDLLRFDFSGAYFTLAFSQIANWLTGPPELSALIPVHVAAVAILIRVALSALYDNWLRLTAWATLSGHAVALLIYPNPRYHLVTWLLTSVAVATWVQQEGVALVQRRFPRWTGKLSALRIKGIITGGLDWWLGKAGIAEQSVIPAKR